MLACETCFVLTITSPLCLRHSPRNLPSRYRRALQSSSSSLVEVRSIVLAVLVGGTHLRYPGVIFRDRRARVRAGVKTGGTPCAGAREDEQGSCSACYTSFTRSVCPVLTLRKQRGETGTRLPPNLTKIFFHWGLRDALLSKASVTTRLMFMRCECWALPHVVFP